jgi:hypothetical protein
MRAHDLVSNSPGAEELERLSRGLTDGKADQVDELRKLFERTAAVPAREEWPPFLQRPRDLVDSRTGGAPTSHRPVLGVALVAAKKAFRGAFQPFINEVMQAQVRFNEAILDAVAQVYDQVQQNAENQALFRKQVDARLKELEARLETERPAGATRRIRKSSR